MNTIIFKGKYNSTGDVCCKCGMVLLSTNTGNPLGNYFIMDKDGNFYCADCDSQFEDNDKRIYIQEEE